VPIEERKGALAELLQRTKDGIAFNQHYAGGDAIIFKHACTLGCEGIVSKRLGSPTARAESTTG
jgi:bifunctional non-homologous end joining protein LigD